MAGRIKQLLDKIVETRSQGNDIIAQATKTKLILKGINPNNYTQDSEDDMEVIMRVYDIARELNVPLQGSPQSFMRS